MIRRLGELPKAVRDGVLVCSLAGWGVTSAVADPVTGVVLDEDGLPLAGVQAKVVPGGDEATSDGEGRFQVDVKARWPGRIHVGASAEFAVRGGVLYGDIPSGVRTATVEMIDCRGRTLSLVRREGLTAGVRRLAEPGNTFGADGFYTVRIRLDREETVVALLQLDGAVASPLPRRRQASSSPRALGKAAGVVDTLLLTREGYVSAKVIMKDFDSDNAVFFLSKPGGYPRVILGNGTTRALVYLPDESAGYYRGSRFDWSGMVGEVTCGGHTYYEDWLTPHDPVNPEHAVGPAVEFDMETPPGYDEAGVGEEFVKIGVGRLRRGRGDYFFNDEYDIVDAGSWTVTRGVSWIRFQHDIDELRGWDYRYVKLLTVSGKSLAMDQTLRNTGTKACEISTYSHQFTSIDKQRIGPGYSLTYVFTPTLRQGTLDGKARLDGSVVTITSPIEASSALWARFLGFGADIGSNRVVIEHEAGGSVAITGNQPVADCMLYSSRRALCPEFFVECTIGPGAVKRWRTVMEYGE